jgi:hypothetical protein
VSLIPPFFFLVRGTLLYDSLSYFEAENAKSPPEQQKRFPDFFSSKIFLRSMLNIPSDIPQFKVVLCGDGGTGKTTLVNKHKTGEFRRAYIPSVGATVIPLDWYTSYGRVVLKIWDTVSTEGSPTHPLRLDKRSYQCSAMLISMFTMTLSYPF